MCLAAMYMAGISEVVFAYSNAEGEPYGLSSAPVYADLVRPLAEIPLKLVHRRVRPAGVEDLYESRSEEHTSELQSLMRISYAVFSLKKKKNSYHKLN